MRCIAGRNLDWIGVWRRQGNPHECNVGNTRLRRCPSCWGCDKIKGRAARNGATLSDKLALCVSRNFRESAVLFDDKAYRSPMKLKYRVFGGIALMALAMLATIPGKSLRSHLARVRFFASCAREFKQIKDLGSCKSEYLTQTLAERPHLIGVAMWPYVNRRWTAAQRFSALQGHYPELDDFPGLHIGTQERVLVSDLGGIVPGLTIAIDRPDWFMREGELTINLFTEAFRAYSLAFTFGRVAGQRVLYVGCIQGRHAQGIEVLYRNLTKKLHGWRPRDVMVSLIQMIGAATDVSTIYLVSDDARVHRHRYFGDRHEGLISANYDEIWTEHGAVAGTGGFFELGTGIRRREPHEMSPNKRAMYRRRYELMDALRRDLASAVSTRGVVSSVQSSRDESVDDGVVVSVAA